jgi:hypothetical protein
MCERLQSGDEGCNESEGCQRSDADCIDDTNFDDGNYNR